MVPLHNSCTVPIIRVKVGVESLVDRCTDGVVTDLNIISGVWRVDRASGNTVRTSAQPKPTPAARRRNPPCS